MIARSLNLTIVIIIGLNCIELYTLLLRRLLLFDTFPIISLPSIHRNFSFIFC